MTIHAPKKKANTYKQEYIQSFFKLHAAEPFRNYFIVVLESISMTITNNLQFKIQLGQANLLQSYIN